MANRKNLRVWAEAPVHLQMVLKKPVTSDLSP